MVDRGVEREAGDSGCRQGGGHSVLADERVAVVVGGRIQRLSRQREVVDGIPARCSAAAVIFRIDMDGVQGLSRIGARVLADAADAGTAELVGDGVCPLASLTLAAVLRQDAVAGTVVNVVHGIAAGQLLVDAVALTVVAVDVGVLLDHRLGVGDVFRFRPVLGDQVGGERRRDDVGEVALRVVQVVGLALDGLADHQPAVQVGVFGTCAAVLVGGLGAEVLDARSQVQVAVHGRVYGDSRMLAVCEGHLLVVVLPLDARLVLGGGQGRQEAVVLRA